MNTPTPGKHAFLDELKRRHVWRVAAAYAIAGWLIVQVATQVFPFFNIPNWTVRLVVLLLLIGFPVAVVLAWVYEITPEGIRRTVSADAPEARAEHATRQIGRRLNALIMAVLVLAVALMGWRLLVLGHAAPGKAVAARSTRAAVAAGSAAEASATPVPGNDVNPASAASIPEKSVAVLPFENDSGEQGQQYFSDGLSQDLITALSQFEGLKVISRDSAFQFRGSKDGPAVIAAKLGVAHLLEGSVQKRRDEVRISVTLVNAADGSVVWSQRYDKPYTDMFALQDAITQAVAAALKAKLLTAPGAVVQSEHPPSGNIKAWQAYQQGNYFVARSTQADDHKALAYYAEATRLDPHYAAAFARMSHAWRSVAIQYLSGTAQQQAYASARRATNQALELAPDLALAHSTRGWLLLDADFDWQGARAEYQRAAQLAPNDADVLFNLGNLNATLGEVRSAVSLTRKALADDPLHATWYNWLSSYQSGLGNLAEAAHAMDVAIEQQPAADAFHEQVAVIAIQRGDAKAALAAARQESDPGWRRIALALALQIGPDRKAADAALQALIAAGADQAPFQIAEVYALRRQPDEMFKWLDRAWAARDPGVSYLLFDPFILRYQHDPRFAAFCKQVGLPTTTDAVALK